jgi:cyclopropane fatty-acyl-phospholipid synthase-like methyltransferase
MSMQGASAGDFAVIDGASSTTPASEVERMSELERWEARFSASGYWFGTTPNAFLARQAHRLRPGQRALAVADGEGRNGVWLAEQGLDVISLDFSPSAGEKARTLAAERGVRLRTEQADLTTWNWPVAEFDVIAAIFVQFVGPALRTRMFDGMKQALKPGGLIIMQGYRPKQLEYRTGGPDKVENLYTRAILEEAFRDLAMVEVNEHDSTIREGSGHNGMSALIDLVAQK